MDPMTIAMLAQAGYGLYRGIKAQQGLRALQKQKMPNFMEAVAPYRENYELYKQQYKGGMGPGSLNLAQQQFGIQQAGLLRTPVSGQLRDQLGRAAAAGTGMFAQNLAAQNEAIRRGAISGMTSANQSISALQQRDIGTRLDLRLRQEQGYGQAMQQGFQDVLGAAGGLAKSQLATQEAAANRDLLREYYNLNKTNPNSTSLPADIMSIPSVGFRQNTTNTNPLAPVGPISVGRMSTPAAGPRPYSTGSAMPEGFIQPDLNGPVRIVGSAPASPYSTGSAMPEGFIQPNLNGPVNFLRPPGYETFMGGPFNPYSSYGGSEGYDLGIPPLRTRYSTPKTSFR
jgi:hypothetical protein